MGVILSRVDCILFNYQYFCEKSFRIYKKFKKSFLICLWNSYICMIHTKYVCRKSYIMYDSYIFCMNHTFVWMDSYKICMNHTYVWFSAYIFCMIHTYVWTEAYIFCMPKIFFLNRDSYICMIHTKCMIWRFGRYTLAENGN